MTTAVLLEHSIVYAERNFTDDNARHLQVDKQFIRQNLDLNGKKVLDFGCGMGGMTLWYATNWNCHVHGVDLDGFHVAVAREMQQRHGVKNVQFEQRDILENPLEEQYDLIVLNDVAEHIPLPALQAIFNQLRHRLAPGGRIFVSYPPWQSPYASHVNRVIKLPWCQFLPQPLLLHWIKRNNVSLSGEHESDLVSAYLGLNHLTHYKLANILAKAGLQVEKRLSHSILRKFPILNRLNPRWFPLHFIITKELLLVKA